ncbi:MAG: cardiolipin synthase B [Candidatus Dactylopiibacterium carminicum]|uniref:Cardiolipin synthase B n=1 Tax=Candidatus Dactylopiibacterium carminicum TaxID=857335 RepID=A0A272EYU3_9RHOO|nr:cardiolipin synthase ClsB [Candidatus Dactylopiibacterium carminicum]KAF7600793.1 cardiolipin synthase ClsB [Candidatus Dactylopiibacterium carminicum]PAS95292.1 MAG: cardiolipin synthase B [Candidatus Dactylopiibacterium carminicum]PAS98696.1 MAG: cardiolipin synthase B [Candidatus Dactylopiibacterium carminicum]PAT00800.1 MAG: cardiolipin synthase B [Candidatus Dactylopiibacterium carminicum]
MSGPRPGNQIQLLHSGGEYFPALLAAIAGAREEILLETYIFKPDAVGREVAAALSAAVLRGVRVRLIVDGFGGRDFVQELMDDLAADGVEVMIFRRELKPLLARRYRLRRLHRKLAVVDARIAFVGGINIIDDFEPVGPRHPRFDFAVRIEGPVVTDVHRAMARLWRLVLWASLKRRFVPLRWALPEGVRSGSMRARLVLRDNLRHRRDIEEAYLDAIEHAQTRILLANAYFFPGRVFRQALMAAAGRGVQVTLLLQGRVEYWLLHHACRALYPPLLTAGVRIVEYRKSFLHAKVAVVDTGWATVGSSNIDPFSLLLAREANVVILDETFATGLAAALQAACTDGGVEVSLADWQRQRWWHRATAWLAYGILRLLLGVAGYASRLK